jgi:hypothetical protein
MAGVKNNKSKREAAKPVLTARVCSQCKENVMSNEVALIKSITFSGAKRSSTWVEFHRKHLPKI